MLHIGGVDIPEDEWDCRKRLFILHELVNRTSFLSSINYDFDNDLKNTQLEYAKEKLSENPFFKTLPEKRQKRLLGGDDMYVDGRHEALATYSHPRLRPWIGSTLPSSSQLCCCSSARPVCT